MLGFGEYTPLTNTQLEIILVLRIYFALGKQTLRCPLLFYEGITCGAFHTIEGEEGEETDVSENNQVHEYGDCRVIGCACGLCCQ